jgi:hypothetical protein
MDFNPDIPDDAPEAIKAFEDVDAMDDAREELAGLIEYLATGGAEAGGISTGTVIMWSGDPNKTPSGWTLCDGSDPRKGKSAVPDLTDRFVVGAGGGHSVGEAGGSLKGLDGTTTSADGSHTHTIDDQTSKAGAHGHTLEDHALAPNEIPSHSHTGVPVYTKDGPDVLQTERQINQENVNHNTVFFEYHGVEHRNRSYDGRADMSVGGEAHSHSMSDTVDGHQHDVGVDDISQTDHSHNLDLTTEPPYFSLAYLMKL